MNIYQENRFQAYQSQTTNLNQGSQPLTTAGSPNINTPILTELRLLPPGSTFTARIADIRNMLILLETGENQTIEATLTELPDFHIGDDVTFQVKEQTPSRILLKPVENSNLSGQIFQKILQSSNLPVTDKNINIVQSLMTEQQPVNRQAVLSMAKLSARFPETEIKQLVMMNKLDLPITEENIRQFERYQNMEHRIVSETEQVAVEIPKFLKGEVTLGNVSNAFNRLQDIINVFHPQTTESNLNKDTPVKAIRPDDSIAQVLESNDGREKLSTILSKLLPEDLVHSMMESPKASAREVLTTISTLVMDKVDAGSVSPNEIISLFESEPFKKLIKESVEHSWMLPEKKLSEPPEVLQQEMKELYQRISEQADELSKVVQHADKNSTSLLQHTTNLKDNIGFMNSLNDWIAYVQIPVRLKDRNMHSELYVYQNKKRNNMPKEELTAFLHLELTNLGATDISIRLQGRRLETGFMVEDHTAADLVEEHLPKLKEKLEQKGYQVTYTIEELKQNQSVFDSILLSDMPEQPSLKRYSFDVRT